MNFRGCHHFLHLLLVFCIVKVCIVQAMNATGTVSPGTESTTISAPGTHFEGASNTVTPTRAPGTSTSADIQGASTLVQNSSANFNNRTEVSSVANVIDLSGSTITPFTEASTVKPGSTSSNSSGLTLRKTSSASLSTASITHRTTTVTKASAITTISATKAFSTKPINNTERTELNTESYDRAYTTINTSAEHAHLNNSEAIVTIGFSIILGSVVLLMLVYSVNKCRTRRSQYSHRPLHDTSYESVERYSAPEDTLVISGGLYDAPRVYNPTMTVLEDEEGQHDYVSFGSRPGQFKLEFLPGEKESEPALYSPDFNTFHPPHH